MGPGDKFDRSGVTQQGGLPPSSPAPNPVRLKRRIWHFGFFEATAPAGAGK
jgi:hypothetical protein